MAPGIERTQDPLPQTILSYGMMALKALDPRFPGITQLWKNTQLLLTPLLDEIKRQIQIRQSGEPDPSLLPELGNFIAEVAQIVARCDPNTIAGQITALEWIGEGLDQILQGHGEIPDLQRLQTLVTLLGMVDGQLTPLG